MDNLQASAGSVAGFWPSVDSFKIVEPRLPRDFPAPSPAKTRPGHTSKNNPSMKPTKDRIKKVQVAWDAKTIKYYDFNCSSWLGALGLRSSSERKL